MANYTKKFTKPYANGYKDRPDTSTPVTADIKNAETNALLAIEEYLEQNNITPVSIDGLLNNGYSIAIVEIDGETYDLNIPELSYESAITGGIKIGQITLGEKSYDLYAPTASAGSNVSVTPKITSGTNIAEITVDGTTYQLYAPTGGSGSGSTVTAEATLKEGTQIGKITIDGVETILYAPNGGGESITVDSALSTESENPVQNKVVTDELNKKIETLDDESQAPDVVNFDLDSELSLTSVKGVQNKAIAEEFQKYANGTKVVAKATEADTATKATQDAQGNTIDTTYAKKTEVPQGTVVDDALSSTSANPVQNKVVKAEFDKVNSNLSDLAYGDNGGYNIFKDTTWFVGRNITENGISDYAETGSAYSDYISIVEPNTYYISSFTHPKSTVFEYDANKSFIKYNGWKKDNNTPCVLSGNCAYIRISFNGASSNIQPSNVMLAKTPNLPYVPYIPSVKMIAEENAQQSADLSNIKDGTTPVAKAVADEDGNNIKSTYAKKTETFETVTEDVNVVLNSDLFKSDYSDITCVRIGKLCVLSFTISVKNTIYSTTDEIVLMTIVGTKYRPKKPDVNSPRQTFQGFAVGNYDENGTQSQSLNNTVRIITSSDSNYTEIITRDKDRINWHGYVQGQIMWVTD